jgi:hypothetical protein
MTEYEERVVDAARKLRVTKRRFIALALRLAEGRTAEIDRAIMATLEAAREATTELCRAACEDEDET